MQYNTETPQIIVPEYGRNIQKMVEYACTVSDREERNYIARSIVRVMGQVNSQYKDSEDFIQKQWDHLFIISDFKLDVDSPYPIPQKEELAKKPKPLKYPSQSIKYRHYGQSIQKFIKKAAEMDDGDEKDSFTYYIANMMKKNYLMYNRETVGDELILRQLNELSDGKLNFKDDFKLRASNELVTKPRTITGGGKKKKKKNYKRKN